MLTGREDKGAGSSHKTSHMIKGTASNRTSSNTQASRAFLSNLSLRQFLTSLCPISLHSNPTSLCPSFLPLNKMKSPAATPKLACPLPAAVRIDNEARESDDFLKNFFASLKRTHKTLFRLLFPLG